MVKNPTASNDSTQVSRFARVIRSWGYLTGMAVICTLQLNSVVEFYAGDPAHRSSEMFWMMGLTWVAIGYTFVYCFIFDQQTRWKYLNEFMTWYRNRKEKKCPPSP